VTASVQADPSNCPSFPEEGSAPLGFTLDEDVVGFLARKGESTFVQAYLLSLFAEKGDSLNAMSDRARVFEQAEFMHLVECEDKDTWRVPTVDSMIVALRREAERQRRLQLAAERFDTEEIRGVLRVPEGEDEVEFLLGLEGRLRDEQRRYGGPLFGDVVFQALRTRLDSAVVLPQYLRNWREAEHRAEVSEKRQAWRERLREYATAARDAADEITTRVSEVQGGHAENARASASTIRDLAGALLADPPPSDADASAHEQELGPTLLTALTEAARVADPSAPEVSVLPAPLDDLAARSRDMRLEYERVRQGGDEDADPARVEEALRAATQSLAIALGRQDTRLSAAQVRTAIAAWIDDLRATYQRTEDQAALALSDPERRERISAALRSLGQEAAPDPLDVGEPPEQLASPTPPQAPDQVLWALTDLLYERAREELTLAYVSRVESWFKESTVGSALTGAFPRTSQLFSSSGVRLFEVPRAAWRDALRTDVRALPRVLIQKGPVRDALLNVLLPSPSGNRPDPDAPDLSLDDPSANPDDPVLDQIPPHIAGDPDLSVDVPEARPDLVNPDEPGLTEAERRARREEREARERERARRVSEQQRRHEEWREEQVAQRTAERERRRAARQQAQVAVEQWDRRDKAEAHLDALSLTVGLSEQLMRGVSPLDLAIGLADSLGRDQGSVLIRLGVDSTVATRVTGAADFMAAIAKDFRMQGGLPPTDVNPAELPGHLLSLTQFDAAARPLRRLYVNLLVLDYLQPLHTRRHPLPVTFEEVAEATRRILLAFELAQDRLDALRASTADARAVGYSGYVGAALAQTRTALDLAETLLGQPPETVPAGSVLHDLRRRWDDVGAIYSSMTGGSYTDALSRTVLLYSEITESPMPDKLYRVASLAATVASARSGAEMEAAFRAAAMPAGGYRGKRSAEGHPITINAYPALSGGNEWLIDTGRVDWDDPALQGGITLPVGVEIKLFRLPVLRERTGFTPLLGARPPVSVFVSFLDLGAMLSYRLSEHEIDLGPDDAGQDSVSVQELPDVALNQVFAPGLFLVTGPRSNPLSLGIGVQLNPALRSVHEGESEVSRQVPALRFGFFLGVDLTLFRF
jgi:hypothetical protein